MTRSRHHRRSRLPVPTTVSHPRRQQYRRLAHAVAHGATATCAALGAVVVTTAGHGTLALGLLACAIALGAAARRSWSLAARSRVGADSEARVRRELRALAGQGWTVRHGVTWPGGGDIDHVVRAPTGIGFAVETKTRHCTPAHLARTVQAARWLGGHRRRYPRGVLPVLCVARAHRREYLHDGVVVVSVDRLLAALRDAAAAEHAAVAREVVGGRRLRAAARLVAGVARRR